MRRATPDILGDVLSAEPGENRLEIRRQLRWDYGQVAPVHRKAVEDAAVDIAVAGRRMASNVVQIGQRLNEVKKLLEHGLFTDWCEVEFGMNIRTAQRWMSVAETLGDKSDKLSHLGSSVLYLLAADSTPEAVREAVIEEAASTGRAPSVAEVKQTIRLFMENLRGIVRLWAEEHWLRGGREIPPNPAHTNGEFWQGLTAWMHANVTDTWTETDLKAAIKQEYRFEARVTQQAAPIAAKVVYVEAADEREGEGELEDLTWDLAPWLRDAGWKQYYRSTDNSMLAIHPVHGKLIAKRGELVAMHRRMTVLSAQAEYLGQPEPAPASCLAASDLQVMQTAPVAIADERRARLGQYLTQFEATLNALTGWAEMTGRFTATGEAERGLRRLIDLTRQEMAAFSGAEGGLDDAAL